MRSGRRADRTAPGGWVVKELESEHSGCGTGGELSVMGVTQGKICFSFGVLRFAIVEQGSAIIGGVKLGGAYLRVRMGARA